MKTDISPKQREAYKEECESRIMDMIMPYNMSESLRTLTLKDWQYATSESGRNMINYIVNNKETLSQEEIGKLIRRFSQPGSGKIFILPLLWECENISRGLLMSNVFVPQTTPPTEPSLNAAFMENRFPKHVYEPIKNGEETSKIIPNPLIIEAKEPDGVAFQYFATSIRKPDDELLMSLFEAAVLFPSNDKDSIQANLRISRTIWGLGDGKSDEEKAGYNKRISKLCDALISKLKQERLPELRFYYKRVLGDILLRSNGTKEISKKIVSANVAPQGCDKFERAFILAQDSGLRYAKIVADKASLDKIYDLLVEEYKNAASEKYSRGIRLFDQRMRLANALSMLINSNYFGVEEQRKLATILANNARHMTGEQTQLKEMTSLLAFRMVEFIPNLDYEVAKILLMSKNPDIYSALLSPYIRGTKREITDTQIRIASDWQEMMKKRNITKSASGLINKLIDITKIAPLTDERYDEILNHHFNNAKPSEKPNNFNTLIETISTAPTTPEKYLLQIIDKQQPKINPKTLIALYCSQNGHSAFDAMALNEMLSRNYYGNKGKIAKNIEVIDNVEKLNIDINNFLQFLRDCPHIQEDVYREHFEKQVETIQYIYDDFKTFGCDKNEYLLCYSPHAYYAENEPLEQIIKSIARYEDSNIKPPHKILLGYFEKEEDCIQACAIKNIKPQKEYDLQIAANLAGRNER